MLRERSADGIKYVSVLAEGVLSAFPTTTTARWRHRAVQPQTWWIKTLPRALLGVDACNFAHKIQPSSFSMITYRKNIYWALPHARHGNTMINRKYNLRVGSGFSEGGHLKSEWTEVPNNTVLWEQVTETAYILRLFWLQSIQLI